MLYESDISNLLSQWQKRLDTKSSEQPYKDALSDCIYDLRCLVDNNHKEEALANEVITDQLEQDAQFWNDYYNAFLNNDGIMAV